MPETNNNNILLEKCTMRVFAIIWLSTLPVPEMFQWQLYVHTDLINQQTTSLKGREIMKNSNCNGNCKLLEKAAWNNV